MPQVGAVPYRPLQQPSRLYGLPAYLPPQMMPFGQFKPPQMSAPLFPPFQQQPVPPPVAVVGQGASRAKKKNNSAGAAVHGPQQVLSQQVYPPQQAVPNMQPPLMPPGQQQGVMMHGQQPGVQQQQVQPVVPFAPAAPAVGDDVVAGPSCPLGKAKAKKATVCWKCAVNTHATKDCTAQHFCLVCNNSEHPTMRCPTLRQQRPSAFTSGFGIDETLFLQLPDSVFMEHLAPSSSPTALVSIVGEPVTAAAIQSLMSRMCPTRSPWTWEAIPHGADAFLIGFPSLEDLQRVDGFQMSVPSFSAQATISVWAAQDIQPKRMLEQVWVHVQGVPYTVRHFLGLWVVGSLIGTTLDVDLVTLRSQNVVRILVAMIDSSVLDKRVDERGPYIGASCVIKLREYDFFFRREAGDFIPDPSFVPFSGGVREMILGPMVLVMPRVRALWIRRLLLVGLVSRVPTWR